MAGPRGYYGLALMASYPIVLDMAQTAMSAHRTPLTGITELFIAAMARLEGYLDGFLVSDDYYEATRMSQSMTVKRLGKGLVTVGLIVVVLNEVFTINAINNSSGPFASVISTVENIGTSAITLAVIGFLILAGAMAMGFMDQF